MMIDNTYSIDLPLINIQEKIKPINEKLNVEIIEIRENSIILLGERKFIRKVFFADHTVGYIVPKDVNQCMICANMLNEDKQKAHCACCGNIICSSCCDCVEELKKKDLRTMVVCLQCSYGQDITEFSPNFEGLPVYIEQLSSYGPLQNSSVKSTKVLRGWFEDISDTGCKRFQRVLINVCLSEDVPSKFSREAEMNENFIFMSFGPRVETSDGLIVYHIIVNSLDFYEKDADNTLEELYEQVIAFITRVSDKLMTKFEICDFLSFYNPLLSAHENNEIAKKIEKNFNHPEIYQDYIVPDFNVVLPNKDLFYELFQIPINPAEFKTFIKIQENPILPLTKNNLNRANPPKIQLKPPSIEKEEASSVTLTDDLHHIELLNNKKRKSESGSRRRNSSFFSTSSISSTIRSMVNPANQGSEMITAEMFTENQHSFLDVNENDYIIRRSSVEPFLILGWLIQIDERTPVRCIITGVKKNLSRKTEFRISRIDSPDIWVRLKRAEKEGKPFHLISKVLNTANE